MSILLALILLANALILALVLVVSFRISAVYRDIMAFVSPKADGKPSDFANFVGVVADTFARSIVAQAKATFMGVQSGQARAEAAVEGDIAEGKLSLASPVAGALLNSFPALKKTIRRNPGLVDLALEKLLSSGGQGIFGGNGNHSETSQPKFKL